MKILVDIGHPAHVHYFRNAIHILRNKGHEFLVTSRDKEVTLQLLKAYDIPYICTGKNRSGTLRKFGTMLRNDLRIYKAARRFQPDVFLSFFSPFAAHVGSFMRKPVIGFTDTEFARLSIRLTRPFTDHIFTPACFGTDFGANHFRFKGYMETFYLHPKYFTPDMSVLQTLKLIPSDRYFVVRFVSFSAGHDAGESGIGEKFKWKIVEALAKHGKVFISSEGPLPSGLKDYKLPTTPEQFHSVLAFSSLYVGEGITTAAECAILGTPAVLINTLTTNYILEHVNAGLIMQYDNAAHAMDSIAQIAADPTYRDQVRVKNEKMMSEHIDCTEFLVNLLDSFPESVNNLKFFSDSKIADLRPNIPSAD